MLELFGRTLPRFADLGNFVVFRRVQNFHPQEPPEESEQLEVRPKGSQLLMETSSMLPNHFESPKTRPNQTARG